VTSSGLLLKRLKKMICQKHEVNTADQETSKFMLEVKFLQNVDSSADQDIAKVQGAIIFYSPSPSH